MLLGQWLGFVALVLSLYILWQIRQMLLVVFAAIVLATALNKLARKIQHQFKLARTVGILAAISIFVGVLVCFFILIVPPFITQFQELTTTKFPAILKSSSQWGTNLASYIPAPLIAYLPNIEDLTKQIQPLLKSFAGQSLTIFSSSLGAVLNLLFMIILTMMMLAQPTAYRQAFIALFPSFYRRRVDGILAECEVSLGKWVGGAILSMIVVAVLSLIGLLSLGIPLALAQAILAGLLNFVPNLGPTISVVIPMSIALLDEPWKAVAIFIIYFLIQQFESSFLTPYIMAQQVSLLPAITLIAQVFFTTFFGFMGLLLALPLTVVAKVWINAVLIEDILDRWKQSLTHTHGNHMLKNTISDQWLETIDKAEETIELIVFAIGEVNFGIPITKIIRVSAPIENQDFQLEPDLEILDLHHQLFGTSIVNPTGMVIFRGDKLSGIPINTSPTLIVTPLDQIRIIPDEFRSNNPLSIANYIAIVSTPTAELTIFILGY